MLAKCVAEILNQILHIFLGRLREILLNIKLADGLAEIAFRNSKARFQRGRCCFTPLITLLNSNEASEKSSLR